ncbi:MAG TPA: DinB family protein [Thermoanaerobaculia bacterium]
MSPKTQYVVHSLEGFIPEIAHPLWVLEETRRRTKGALKNIDAATLDWAPPQGGNSIGTLLYHIAEIEMDWLYVEVLEQGRLSPEAQALLPFDAQDGQGNLTAILGVGIEEHLRRLDATRAIFLETFHKMTHEEFRRLRSFEQYDCTPEWVVYHLIQHESEHRGQIKQIRASAKRALRV